MLKKIRVSLEIIFFLLITLLFLDISGLLHTYFAIFAEIQFVPALLARNLVILVLLLLLTWLFGRIYCSVICPLGVYQDIVSYIARRIKPRKKRRYTYSKAKTVLRVVLLVIFIAALIAGIALIPALLDPYAAYGRLVTELAGPVYTFINNLFAGIAAKQESYLFTDSEIWTKGVITLATAIITLGGVGYLAWRSGRTYCNTLCPVGTLLGFISRYAFFRVRIDESTCNKCGKCARNCKASCIDFRQHTIDYSRCVSCFDCISSCPDNSITFTTKRIIKKEPATITGIAPDAQASRRNFLATTLVMAATAVEMTAQQKKRSMIDIPAEYKENRKRTTPISPPGSEGHAHLNQHCTACLLCVAQCPVKILRPSVNEYGWMSVMQPVMSYEKGYCLTHCTVCSDVCPTDAIRKITPADKTRIAVGHALYVRDNCIVVKDDVNCDGCWRICPTEAITRVTRDGGQPAPETDINSDEYLKQRLVPSVDNEKCIGCGACEYICPARPLAAIYVEGNAAHHQLH
jgi:ferredoxin